MKSPLNEGTIREAEASMEEGEPEDASVLLESMLSNASLEINPPEEPATSTSDSERLVLTAEREIVLQCGSASITLTRAGKIIIRGEYVVTRAAGVNRILGGSVQIN
jgi:hypothetical protein